mgnify:FL=1
MRTSFFVYMSIAGQKHKKLNIAEIGVYKGDNAMSMLTSTDNIDKLYLIDTYEPYYKWFTDEIGAVFSPEKAEIFFETTKKRFEIYNGKVSFIRKDSSLTAQDFPDSYFHYVYIDGGHDYDIVKKDINAWYPKVKELGVLGGHDSVYPDVSTAIIEFATSNKLTVHFVNAIRNGLTYPEVNNFEDWWILKVPCLTCLT